MSHPRVVHNQKAPYDVFIGRGADPNTGLKEPTGEWGNQFRFGIDGTREEVIERHRQYVLQRPWLVDKIRSVLKDKTLGCWCAPHDCHGDTLARIADSTPVPHVAFVCDKECTGCQFCDGGLTACVHCGGGEGAMTSECPRTKDAYDSGAVYQGRVNYICGTWVPGAYAEEDEQRCMPCWAGVIHIAGGKT